MGSVERIEAVAGQIHKFKKEGHDIVVVVSAMSGETNRLIALAKDITDTPDPREMDVLVSTGEQVTIALLAMALKKIGLDARSYTGAQVRILTDDSHTKARIQEIDRSRIEKDLKKGRVVIVAGFQGVDQEGDITTLGRGGSDTTGVAIAAAIEADECQIFTDVDGVYTTDPRVVKSARKLEHITFEEMLEMASQGSKVLQIRSVEFAGKYEVPLRVLSSFKEIDVAGGELGGTLISLDNAENTMEKPVVSGIAFNRDEAKVSVVGIPDKPGVASDIISPVGDANIEVDVIVQNAAADQRTDLTFTVHRNDLERAKDVAQDVADKLGARAVNTDAKIAKVSIVGVGMRSHAGVASTMFKALASENINIQMITTSEIKISVIIDERYLELAVRTLHSVFGLDDA